MLLAGCLGRTAEPQVVLQTEYQKQNVPIQERPAAVNFPPVDWYVVTEDNLEEFLQRVEADTGNVVFFAITSKGYENLSLAIGDMRRYIKEQQAIIVYYEDAVKSQEETPAEK